MHFLKLFTHKKLKFRLNIEFFCIFNIIYDSIWKIHYKFAGIDL
jgi:hypothetical protein